MNRPDLNTLSKNVLPIRYCLGVALYRYLKTKAIKKQIKPDIIPPPITPFPAMKSMISLTTNMAPTIAKR